MTRTALALLALFAASPAQADMHLSKPAEVDVLPGWRTEDGTHMAALRVVLADGWKTYWRAPGEAGIPPSFDWSGSENLAEVRFHWPVPEVSVSNGMTSLVYSHELILPMEVVPVDAAADVSLAAALKMGVCQDICMPMEAEIAAWLEVGTTQPDRRIAVALERRPDTAAEAGLISAECSVEPIGDGLKVTATLDLPRVGPDEVMVLEPSNREIWVSEAMTRRTDGTLTATAELVPPNAKPFDLVTETLRLTVLAAGRAVDIAGCDRRR